MATRLTRWLGEAMSSEGPPRGFAFWFLELIALGCVLEAIEGRFAAGEMGSGMAWLVAGLAVGAVGFNWPKITAGTRHLGKNRPVASTAVAAFLGALVTGSMWWVLVVRPAQQSVVKQFPNVMIRSLASLDPSPARDMPAGSYVYMLPYVAFTNNEPTSVSLEVGLRVQNPEQTLREGFGDINKNDQQAGWTFSRAEVPMNRLQFLKRIDTRLNMAALAFPLNLQPGPGVTAAGAIAFLVNSVQFEAMQSSTDPHMHTLMFYLDVRDFQTGTMKSIRVMTLKRGDHASPSSTPKN